MNISLDDMLNKKITIREGINMGLITSNVLSDCDMFIRVHTVMEKDKILKTHAVERVAEMCKVSQNTVWRCFSVTAKIMGIE
jgi:hypothetical protein